MRRCYFIALYCLVLHCLDNGVYGATASPNKADSRCEKAIDLAFVIDSSSSVYIEDFKLQKRSIHDIVELFDVRPDKTQVAAVSFSEDAYPAFNFNQRRTKEDVLNAIDQIDHSEGQATRTYKALEYTREVLFDSNNGARKGVVPQVAVLFTDGQTNPGGLDRHTETTAKAQTIKEANLLAAGGVHVFAIGIGVDVNKTELNLVASDPRYRIDVPRYSSLDTEEFRNLLAYRICTSDETTTPPPITTHRPPSPPGGDPNETCQGKAADIIFVLDESSSIHSPENFRKELNFVNSVIDFFNVGPGDDQSRIGVIGFSDNAMLEFNINQYNNKAAVQSAVSSITWAGGNTFTDKALSLLMTMFSQQHRTRGNVAQIAIIITDGNSTNPWKTREVAAQVQAKGIYCFAIGVGQTVYDPELDILASDPNHLYKFRVENLGALNTIKNLLAYTVCKEKKNETTEEVCGQKQADVVFIADASTSIGERDFEKQREFIYDIVHNFDIGPDNTRVALITFSNQSHVHFNLNQFTDKQSLHNAIDSVPWTGGTTHTAEAIQMMMNLLESSDRANQGVPKIGIVITDGWSWDPDQTKANAARAHEMGILMFSIGVGNYIVPEELDAMATKVDYSFMVDDYSALKTISDSLAYKACDVSQRRRGTVHGKREELKNLLREFKYPFRTWH